MVAAFRPTIFEEQIHDKAIRMTRTAARNSLGQDDRGRNDPGPGDPPVVGLNFIDVYQRSGLYCCRCRSRSAMEGAGVVEAVGGVTHEGTAHYASNPPGSEQVRVMPAACRLPDAISFRPAPR